MMAGCDGKMRQLLVIVGFHVALRVKSVCAGSGRICIQVVVPGSRADSEYRI
jgi:hypothetical protein